MKNNLRADQVKMCNVVADRPGIIQSFMTPVKLKNQERIGQKFTDLTFSPDGKTLVGGVQWRISMKRPGLAEPLIVAKQELKDLERGQKVEAALATQQAKQVAKAQAAGAAKQIAKIQAASAEAEKSVAEMAGLGYWRRRR